LQRVGGGCSRTLRDSRAAEVDPASLSGS
jgi:hypothetical protein